MSKHWVLEWTRIWVNKVSRIYILPGKKKQTNHCISHTAVVTIENELFWTCIFL